MNKIQSFSRYEFKFLLDRKRANLIEKESRFFMKYDENINKKFDKRYFVRSLYFDNIF